ncbi:hypothetical protein L7F22_041055 [Adiantum nelumboides]|nr:hypothetical protein [Adiantum nelumboides]
MPATAAAVISRPVKAIGTPRLPYLWIFLKLVFATFLVSLFTSSLLRTLHNRKFAEGTTFPRSTCSSKRAISECNLAEGNWVFDREREPLYGEACPFHRNAWNCEKNKRTGLDDIYKWKWVPHSCSLSATEPTRFLSSFQNMNLGFVGDSLNENLIVSLLCILASADPGARRWKKRKAWRGAYFPKYNVTVGYHRAVLLADYHEQPSTHGLVNGQDRNEQVMRQTIPMLTSNSGCFGGGSVFQAMIKPSRELHRYMPDNAYATMQAGTSNPMYGNIGVKLGGNFGSGMPLLKTPVYDNLTLKAKDYKAGGQAVKFDTFHGTYDKLKALIFLQQFVAAFAGGNFIESLKIRKVATFLKTNALQWWTSFLNQGVVPSTWVQFKQIFAPAWISNTFEVDVMTTWNQLSAVNCESLEEYNA